jgi:hypothetical protein
LFFFWWRSFTVTDTRVAPYPKLMWYLGMVFYRTLNMAESAEHASRPFLASAQRIRKFVREHALADRPHTSLWLAKAYVIPAGIYGSQIWGTVIRRQAGISLARCLRFSCIFWRAC